MRIGKFVFFIIKEKGKKFDSKGHWKLPRILKRLEGTKLIQKNYPKTETGWHVARIKREMLQLRKHVTFMDNAISGMEFLIEKNKSNQE